MKYQYWAHKKTGETWAVQIKGGRVVGACGPLYYAERPSDMTWFEYSTEDVDWINSEEFQLDVDV